eukprot:CAMPEP_0113466414 /NCGR_PEP_ID=MMETSP0014_2-20120614/14258_1 /TAXON_ID=2857 /ORGANISM="Nitzschia sp." /LENGTH=183 /DNA_ID=CAMNT_0000358633 /DNA_START=134 /DNA_END=685 /DNA_ORIENTATION=- /assembly_acc=CAM_ASM_000159
MELVTVAILSLPVPRPARNWICRECSKLDLKKQLEPVLQAIGVGLVVAIVDGVNNLLSILEFEKRDDILLEDTRRYYGDGGYESVARRLDKEIEYKIERNLYLAAFAFTLLFVIGRLTDLMQEHAELEDELKTALQQQQRQRSSKIGSGNTITSSGTSQQADDDNVNDEAGIEMKPIQSKKKD